MIQQFPGIQGQKILLRCWETGVQSCCQPLTVGAVFQKLWFQEVAKQVINATESWKWGEENHFRVLKCGRSDYSNQNAIPFCYSLSWTARLREKSPNKEKPYDPKLWVSISVTALPGTAQAAGPKGNVGFTWVCAGSQSHSWLLHQAFHS